MILGPSGAWTNRIPGVPVFPICATRLRQFAGLMSMHRSNTLSRIALIVSILLACCSSAFALNPALDVSQYAHTAWRVREGFCKGRINSITQTPDGYLWLGTEFGVLRFDGVRAVPWQPPPDQPLPSNLILNLMGARDGTLWIGTDKGLVSWNGKKLTQYPEIAKQFVFHVLEDQDGVIWAGTLDVTIGKLYSIHKGTVQRMGEDGTFGNSIRDLYEDTRGILWVEGQNGLWQWNPGSPKFIPINVSAPKSNLAEDVDDTLILSISPGVRRLVDGKFEPHPLLNSIAELNAYVILRDRDRSLWIGTSGRGIVHVHNGTVDFFTMSQGLSGDQVTTLFEDREGNFWVGTADGLDRFRELAVPTFSLDQNGTRGAASYSILATSEGMVLATTPNGLKRWNGGGFANYGVSSSPEHVPLSMFQDSRRRIWSATKSEFGYLEDGHLVAVINKGGVVRSIVEDKQGDLWIANQREGLLHLRGPEVVEQIPWAKLGRDDFATALAVDAVRGGLWLGFFKGGVSYFKDGQVRAVYGPGEGLGDGLVNDFQIDTSGTVWIATLGGLSRLRNNRVATLTVRNGLPCDAVQWLREDASDAYWVYTGCGLVNIARSEMEKWSIAVDATQDSSRTIQITVLDILDGMRSQAYPSGFYPSVARTADGKLWIPSLTGIRVLDPYHLPFNKFPPPVHIEQVTADNKIYEMASDGSLSLPALTRDLQIDYTALSLVAPEKMRFRYKLEGYDQDWQEAGNRRQAFYANLPPRSYRFRVMACNNSGVWNETGAFLDFNIAPAYYQTTWFRLLVVVGLALALAALYKQRLRQVAAVYKGRMEARVHERERIARDLHDTFLQSVQGLILKFDAVAKEIPQDLPARMAMETALDRADEVMAEGRDRVRNLRDASPLLNLPTALTHVFDENSQDHKMTFKMLVEGRTRELNPSVVEESYSIGREALINALTHSKGQNVEAEITYDRHEFRLRIRDDGRGIDPKVLNDGSRPDHFGLPGMRERAERIDAQLKLWSGADTGTEVELLVPASTAYRKVNGDRKRSWFRFQ